MRRALSASAAVPQDLRGLQTTVQVLEGIIVDEEATADSHRCHRQLSADSGGTTRVRLDGFQFVSSIHDDARDAS